MIIRKATISDVPSMTAILNEVIKIGGTTAYETPITAAYFTPFLTSPDPRVLIHVAEQAEVLGFQWVEPSDEDLGNIATFAKPGRTQRGIGSALFQKTRAVSKAVGFKSIKATIRADNTGGLLFYSKLGFTDHSVRKAVPLIDGTLVDRIQKRIDL